MCVCVSVFRYLYNDKCYLSSIVWWDHGLLQIWPDFSHPAY